MKVILLISNKQTDQEVHKNQTPAPLIKFGGKLLLEHILSELLLLTEEDIQEVVFVTSKEVSLFHATLKQIATKLNLKTHIFTCVHGNSPLEALACAADVLKGPVLVLNAHAWFKGGSSLTNKGENFVLVKKVEDPSEHNVVKLTMNNAISGFHFKSIEYISDLVPTGGYFFKAGESVIPGINQLLSTKTKEDDSLDLNHLIAYKIENGERFLPSLVEDWIDGNQVSDILDIHQRVIAGFTTHRHIADSAQISNTVIISPVYIGDNVKITNENEKN